MKSKDLFPPVFSRHALFYQCRLDDIMSRGGSAVRMRAIATRIEGMDDIRRQAIMDEAVATLRQDHPGRIVTKGRNHVLLARA